MTREWVDDAKKKPVDKRWVMHCDVRRHDGSRCPNKSKPTASQPDLAEMWKSGWFVAHLYGDLCPDCLARGYQPWAAPHQLSRARVVTTPDP